ncbi:MAG: glycine oxidase ThiO, partial [Frankiaceae bacterium]|nr:glycine oxidase ThiO [Frankiaceae bacterium]
MRTTTDVAVVGGGIIGAAIAWRLAADGATVTVIDPEPGRGATHAAAGMLAPVTELHYGEERLLRLNLASAERYPDFVAALGVDVGYRRTGTVVAAWDGADLAALRDLADLHASLGLRSELLTARELRGLEPSVAAGLPGGLYAADDHAVDPRRLHAALLNRANVVPQAATSIASGAVTLANGDSVSAGTVVVAAGARSGQIEGVPPVTNVRPVKGQTLRLRADRPVLDHVLRGSVRGVPVYLVPRENGEVVVGASSEEAGYDERPRAGAVYDLLRDAQLLLPAVTEMELVEVCTGLRPATPDNTPFIGTVEPGLVVATGHYRNGVL